MTIRLFLILVGASLFTGCVSNDAGLGSGSETDAVSFPNPSRFETQQQMQDIHNISTGNSSTIF